MKTDDQWLEIARGNIERNLSDAVMEDGPDSIYDSCYTLAFDALHDAGCERQKARDLARQLAMCYAQP